jgi:hypothetical protein
LATQIDDSAKRWIESIRFAHLHELDPAMEVIHDLLVAANIPRLDGVVSPATWGDEPERCALTLDGLYLVEPRPLHIGNVDVAFECRRPNVQAETVVEMVDEAMNEVIWSVAALSGRRTAALDDLDVRIVLVQGSQMRIALP